MTTPPQDVYQAAARARDDVALAEWGLRGRTDWIDQPVDNTAALRICGNGVVPQQAAAAYRLLGVGHG